MLSEIPNACGGSLVMPFIATALGAEGLACTLIKYRTGCDLELRTLPVLESLLSPEGCPQSMMIYRKPPEDLRVISLPKVGDEARLVPRGSKYAIVCGKCVPNERGCAIRHATSSHVEPHPR